MGMRDSRRSMIASRSPWDEPVPFDLVEKIVIFRNKEEMKKDS